MPLVRSWHRPFSNFILSFLDQLFRRWTRVAIVLWAVERVPDYFFSGTRGRSPDLPTFILLAAFIVSGVIAQIYRYRRGSNATERQQTKWVVFGVTTTFSAVLILLGSINLFPASQNNIVVFLITFFLVGVAETMIPVSIGIAILHSHLWDIDLLINRTLVYVPLTAIVAGVFAASITLSQKLFVALTENNPMRQPC